MSRITHSRSKSWLALALQLALALPALAQTAPEPATGTAGQDAAEEQALRQQIEELDQRLRILERKRELEAEQAAEKAKTATAAVASKDGFQLKSADGAFVLKLRGYVQADGQFFTGEQPAGVDTFVLRRVRPVLEGTVWKIVDFKFMPDFGLGTTVIQDAYVDVRLAPALKIRAGKFKPPVGLERLRSATAMTFALRGLPTTIVPNRDLGIEIFGDLAGRRIEYAVGVFNGVADGGSSDQDINKEKELAARVFYKPFAESSGPLAGLGFGIAGTSGKHSGTVAAPGLATYRTTASFFGYRSDGTTAGTTIAAGDRRRLSPQASYFRGPFGVLAEYAESRTEVRRAAARATLRNSASQLALSWVFGGENTFNGVNVKQDFTGFGSGPGALEIAARFHEASFDSAAFPIFANPAAAAEKVQGWGLGLNWWANRGLRTLVSYEEFRFDGGAAGGDRPDEKVLFTRVQVSF